MKNQRLANAKEIEKLDTKIIKNFEYILELKEKLLERVMSIYRDNTLSNEEKEIEMESIDKSFNYVTIAGIKVYQNVYKKLYNL